jgi:hypothetical protein
MKGLVFYELILYIFILNIYCFVVYIFVRIDDQPDSQKKSSRVLVSNYKKDNMNLIIVTINDSNDWNHHKDLIKDLDDYKFIMLFNKGVYDVSIDVTYYLHIKESIIIPIKDNEEVKLNLFCTKIKKF